MVESIPSLFPGLAMSDFLVTSPATRDYNCIAWATGDTARWWWPDPDADNDAVYWPAGVAREETLESLMAAFATVGFVPCSGEEHEPHFERVALFASNGAPTHAARQLPNGRWTSKLGKREDIEHELHAVGGDLYGIAAVFLKRPVPIATK